MSLTPRLGSLKPKTNYENAASMDSSSTNVSPIRKDSGTSVYKARNQQIPWILMFLKYPTMEDSQVLAKVLTANASVAQSSRLKARQASETFHHHPLVGH